MTNYELKNKKSFYKNKGFTILFTVLISSIVLAITIGIANIAYRETLLSIGAKEGNYALFAADTGAECALYWDLNQSAFTSSAITGVTCNNTSNAVTINPTDFYLFRISLNNNKNCAQVTVDKTVSTQTAINSLGYNISCSDLVANTNIARKVERALRVTYTSGTPLPPPPPPGPPPPGPAPIPAPSSTE
jgi:hypothetical protein